MPFSGQIRCGILSPSIGLYLPLLMPVPTCGLVQIRYLVFSRNPPPPTSDLLQTTLNLIQIIISLWVLVVY